MSTSPRTKLVADLNRAVQMVGNRTVLFTHVIADNIGLSATEFECLDFIQSCGPVPVGKLADLTGLTSGAVTGLVDRLERAGFLRRQADAADRRRTLVSSLENPEAVAKVVALYQPVAAEFEQITHHYSDAELAVITRYLNESLDMIDRVTAKMVEAKRRG